MCDGPTIELGCGPGRLVARLVQRGHTRTGHRPVARPRSDWPAVAVRPALLGDVFEPLPGIGRWQTVLLVDGNVGLGGDPLRSSWPRRRAAEPAADVVSPSSTPETIGIQVRWVRLESAREVGPWFRWASVGVDSAATLAAQVGLTVTSVRLIGGRVIATLLAV